jgi:hypothetical protein
MRNMFVNSWRRSHNSRRNTDHLSHGKQQLGLGIVQFNPTVVITSEHRECSRMTTSTFAMIKLKMKLETE